MLDQPDLAERKPTVVRRSSKVGGCRHLSIVEVGNAVEQAPDQFLINTTLKAPTIRIIRKDGVLAMPPEPLDISTELARRLLDAVCAS